ncbi:MAG: S49 family peptidase [Burkholderiaceae bacterium]|nr:S49 family peptidase [Burkholderiaceae bacterium]
MNISDILNAPWAIEPSRLVEMHAIYAAHLRGEVADIGAIEARIGKPLDNQPRSYEIRDGVAILPVEGVIAKKMNMFSRISGGASSQMLNQYVSDALADAAVHSIVLAIDSPGGAVDGTQILADTILAGRAKKPIVAHGSGTVASAAYWIGSAARNVYIADGTTMVGSIGVVTSHTDVSAEQTARGIKTTEISAGKYKRIASQYTPLTAEGRQSIQDQIDYLYSLFVGAVAQHRAVSVDVVLEKMADGRVFTGQQAIDAGLVDGILTLDALIAKLNQEHASSQAPRRPSASLPTSTQPKGNTVAISAEQFQAENPQAADALRAEGAAAERARIQAVEAQTMPGHETLIAQLKFDGKSSGGDAALAVLAAEKASRAKHVQTSAQDAPAPVPAAVTPAVVAPAAPVGAELSREELDVKAKAYMADHPGTSYIAAYKAVGGK